MEKQKLNTTKQTNDDNPMMGDPPKIVGTIVVVKSEISEDNKNARVSIDNLTESQLILSFENWVLVGNAPELSTPTPQAGEFTQDATLTSSVKVFEGRLRLDAATSSAKDGHVYNVDVSFEYQGVLITNPAIPVFLESA